MSIKMLKEHYVPVTRNISDDSNLLNALYERLNGCLEAFFACEEFQDFIPLSIH